MTAFLLTGHPQLAETAVLESIRSWNSQTASNAELLQGTIRAALLLRTRTPEQLEGVDEISSLLPAELQRVLRLPVNLRHCFVLRILMRLPGDVCGQFLQLQRDQLDERTCAALRELAGDTKKERMIIYEHQPRTDLRQRTGGPLL